MEKFVIEGGAPLSGTVLPAGNKNAALPILAACVLTEDEIVLRNVPRIRDVEAMLQLLRDLGVRVDWRGVNEVVLCAAGVERTAVDREQAGFIRASFLVAGPLLARFGVTATCRASFALYNTREEVDILAQALRKAQEFLS